MCKVAVVTGSNKGIGFGIVQALCQSFDGVVYLTSRDESRGQEAVTKLNAIGLKPSYHRLDIADRSSVEQFRDYVEQKYGAVDILINNAAIVDPQDTYEVAQRIIDTNYRSIFTLKELIFPLVRDGGRILNISSDCGHLSNIRNERWIARLSKKDLTEADVDEFVDWYLDSIKNGTFDPADIADGASIASYRVSKVALSAVTKVHQRELEARNICVNSLNPGLVRTDMTRGAGFYSAQEAARTPAWLVLRAPPTLRGAYVWHDRREIDWYDYKADYYFKIKALMG